MSWGLLHNPYAGAGRARGVTEQVLAWASPRWGPPTHKVELGHPAQAEAACAPLRSASLERVVVVGGDGTFSAAVHGLTVAGPPEVPLVLVPAGTGGDIGRGLRLRGHRVPDLLAACAAAPPTWVDLLELQTAATTWRGLNVGSAGMSADVVEQVNGRTKRWGGALSFGRATLAALPRFVAAPVELSWTDGSGARGGWSGSLQNLFVSNGRVCGGGMWVAPDASLHDGLLDVVIIPQMPLAELAWNLPRLYTGAWRGHPSVQTFRVRTLSVRSTADPVRCEMDGELRGASPAAFRCIQEGVKLLAPPPVP